MKTILFYFYFLNLFLLLVYYKKNGFVNFTYFATLLFNEQNISLNDELYFGQECVIQGKNQNVLFCLTFICQTIGTVSSILLYWYSLIIN